MIDRGSRDGRPSGGGRRCSPSAWCRGLGLRDVQHRHPAGPRGAHRGHRRTTPTASRRIDIDNSTGSVTIVGTAERDEITVTAEISDGLRATGERQTLVGDRLELRASCPLSGPSGAGVRYTIEVPADIDIHVDTDNGRLDGCSGVDGDRRPRAPTTARRGRRRRRAT